MPLAEWSAQFLPDYILEHLELNQDEKETGEETDEKAKEDVGEEVGEEIEIIDT